MKLLKRKDSLTFKREKPLAKQERIYLRGEIPRRARNDRARERLGLLGFNEPQTLKTAGSALPQSEIPRCARNDR